MTKEENMQIAQEHHNSMPVAEAIQAVKRYKNALLTWFLLFIAVGTYYLQTSQPQFLSSAAIILNPSRQPVSYGSSASETGAAQILDSSQTESQIQVLRSERVLSQVFDLLNLQESKDFKAQSKSTLQQVILWFAGPSTSEPSPEKIRLRQFQAFINRVAARRIGQSYVIEVSYQGSDPVESARITNAIIMQYIKLQIELKLASMQRGNEYLKGRIESIKAQYNAASEAIVSGVIPDTQFPDADAQVISSANPPLSKSSPKPALIYAISLTAAFFSGFSAIVILNLFDKTIRTVAQVRFVLGAECYASVPKVGRLMKNELFSWIIMSKQANRKNREIIFLDSLQILKSSISISNPKKLNKVIGIVSLTESVGKTTISTYLAAYYYACGQSVSLVNYTDEINPFIEKLLSQKTPGNPVFLDTSRFEGISDMTQIFERFKYFSNLSVNSIGHSTHRLDVFDKIVNMANEDGDVIVDFPSIMSDPVDLALYGRLDSLIFVVEAGKTTLEDASLALKALRASSPGKIGVVINKLIH